MLKGRNIITRAWLLILLSFVTSLATAQGGLTDPAFAKVPFDRWLAEGERAQIRWRAQVGVIGLSNHQRLRARIEINVDGSELAKRGRNRPLVVLVQFDDNQGQAYQTHSLLVLQDLDERAASKIEVSYSRDAFLLPGEYHISMGVFDPSTQEHSVTQRKLPVLPLKSDPLPDAWRDLPPVQFLPTVTPPESWFLPSVPGRLHLPLETRHPVHIEVLVNASPTEWVGGSRMGRVNNMNLTALMPALKVISQIDLRSGSLDVALLDLTRRRVSFEQQNVRELDWTGLSDALTEANPNKIDVHSLENREQNAQFFVAEVKRRITAVSDPLHILIVLSGPMAFREGEDLHPIDVPKNPNCRVFYLRFYPPTRPPTMGDPVGAQVRGRPNVRLPAPTSGSMAQMDSLEGTLKPVEPRLFELNTPEQFRKALGTLLGEIARMGAS